MKGTFGRYVARRFALGFGIVLVALALAGLLFQFADGARGELAEAALTLAALRAPNLLIQMLPFATLLGAMLCFWQLTRTGELVAARAAGLSAWRFLAPAVAAAFAIGMAAVLVLNPLGAAFLSRADALERRLGGEAAQRAVDVAGGGVWLRQPGAAGPVILHADRLVAGGTVAQHVTLFTWAGPGLPVTRADAPRADIEAERWVLREAWVNGADGRREAVAELAVPVRLSLDELEGSVAPPETLPVWVLPDFIEILRQSGLSATRQRLHLHATLALPMLLAGLVLAGAAITLRTWRQGRAVALVGGGLLAVFALFFLADVVRALGLNDTLPPALAAWIPPAIAWLGGLAALLPAEEG